MSSFIYIFFYVLLVGEIIWWFTCVNRKDIPLILELLVIVAGLCPGIHIFTGIFIPILCTALVSNKDLMLKNNWFNRKFLNYHDE